MMVGREVNALFSHRTDVTAGDVALAVEGLSRRGTARDPSATVLADVSLHVRRGEILGIAGLVGAGRTEMARAVFGADPFDAGRILVDGQPVAISSPRRRSATASAWCRRTASSRRSSCLSQFARICRWPRSSG